MSWLQCKNCGRKKGECSSGNCGNTVCECDIEDVKIDGNSILNGKIAEFFTGDNVSFDSTSKKINVTLPPFPDLSKFVTLDTAQTITGDKRFDGKSTFTGDFIYAENTFIPYDHTLPDSLATDEAPSIQGVVRRIGNLCFVRGFVNCKMYSSPLGSYGSDGTGQNGYRNADLKYSLLKIPTGYTPEFEGINVETRVGYLYFLNKDDTTVIGGDVQIDPSFIIENSTLKSIDLKELLYYYPYFQQNRSTPIDYFNFIDRAVEVNVWFNCIYFTNDPFPIADLVKKI